jgi:DMSO/TMAO reductase YedYZ molybdopterin-dependent catalytic subunit
MAHALADLRSPFFHRRRLGNRWAGLAALRAASIAVVVSWMMIAAFSVSAEFLPGASVRIGGDVPHPKIFTASDLAALPQRKLEVRDEKGAKEVYQGVAVVELLRRAGAPLGKELRGPKMKIYVLVSAKDGYQAVFALAEFDPGFSDNVILLASARDDKPLNEAEGPLRLIVPQDKRHARWVKQVTGISLQTAP